MSILTTPQPARHPNPTIRASRLGHLLAERPDLDRAEAFFHDFGLRTADKDPNALHLRSATAAPPCYVIRRGPVARFLGLALEVPERGDLERAGALPGASPIEPLRMPGGGHVVRLRDPSGFLVEVVYGQTPDPAASTRSPLTLNSPTAQPRVNTPQRPARAPADVTKLGHVVLEVADYQATCAWYTEHFGFIPSDVEVLPDGSPAITFFRLDRGDQPTDHHTLAIAQGFAPRFNHAAFEVTDLDAIAMGGRLLADQGYEHAWGIGRHLLGSQIFDYWRDPWGQKHEHYCDGDVFTAEVPTGVKFARPGGLAQWGPPVPASFLRPELSLENLLDLARNVLRSPDLSLQKLATMARLVG